MAKASDNRFPKVTFAEKANDGSETPTPSAGHHNLFVGEDGAARLKDESGTVTPLAGSFTGDAGDVPYTPAEAADWDTPPPDDVAEALDELAARESGSGNGGSGDYIEINDSGAEAARSDLTLQNQSTNNARSGVIHIPNFNQSDAFKVCNQITNANNNHIRLFVASTDPLNAVRVKPSGTAELTGGSIFIFGR